LQDEGLHTLLYRGGGPHERTRYISKSPASGESFKRLDFSKLSELKRTKALVKAVSEIIPGIP